MLGGGNGVRMLGKAGEHIAAADLFLTGWVVAFAAEGQTYDLIAEKEGRLIRVAVKATAEARPRRKGARDAYCFTVARRHPRVRRLLYTRADCDVVALVAVDARRVAYISIDRCPSIVWVFNENAAPAERRFGPKVSCMRRFDQHSFEDACGGQ